MYENFDLNEHVDFSSEHIGMEHIDEHEEHVYSQKCERPDIFDRKGFENAVKIYHKKLEIYNSKNWLIRLFTKKPVKPELIHFMNY